MPETSRVFLGADSLEATNNGVGRVARLVARVLSTEASKGSIRATICSWRDGAINTEFGLPSHSCAGSRFRYASKVWKASLTHNRFIYNFLGMARPHCLIPFLKHPLMAFICGIEVWEHASRHRIQWAERADSLVSISEYTKHRAKLSNSCAHNSRVCWLGTEDDDESPCDKKTSGPPTVTILSRLDGDGYKGHRELIAAWPRILSAVPDARFVIAGAGPGADALRSFAQRSAGCQQIEFRGFIPQSEMEALWRATDVFAMPSRGEGFGLVYIEAMRHGKPVIASTHDAGSEINLHGFTGYNVSLDNDHDLPDCVIHLLRSPDHATELGLNGKARWREHFSFSAFRNRFAPILHEFLR